MVAISSPTGVIVNNLFFAGLVVFIIGFAIEVIADNQKSKFRLDEKNKNMFINQGLWSKSRHPNYFGEIMLWTGITIMSIPSLIEKEYLIYWVFINPQEIVMVPLHLLIISQS